MIFTGFIDESDTHGDKPDIAMAALLGTGRQWELFSRGLKNLQQQYGFKMLHAVDFKNRASEFGNWPDQKFREVFDALGQLIADNLTEAVSGTLRYEIYRDHFRDVRPSKMHATSQYGILFLAVMDGLTKRILEEGENHRLSVVVEDGHPNASDTGRLFRERKEEMEKSDIDFLRTHSLVSKKDSPVLMAVDMIAHGYAMELRAMRAGKKPHYRDRADPAPIGKQTGWTVLEVTPGYLKGLIERYNENQSAKRDEYFRRKAAYLASKEGGG